MSTEQKILEPRSWKEGRRLRALELYLAGWRAKDIALALGVGKSAVSQWLKKVREGGQESLRDPIRPGPTPKISEEQRDRLLTLLEKGAEHFGFQGEVWTCPRVAELIEAEFGIVYHPAHLSRLLRSWGWSPQKPVRRAIQRDEAEIKTWKKKTWPKIKKSPD